MVGNQELAKKLHELLKRYGLPAETKTFTVRVEPYLVTVDCDFYPSRIRKRAAPKPAPVVQDATPVVTAAEAEYRQLLADWNEARWLLPLRRVADGR